MTTASASFEVLAKTTRRNNAVVKNTMDALEWLRSSHNVDQGPRGGQL
jgi:hypothetical protein